MTWKECIRSSRFLLFFILSIIGIIIFILILPDFFNNVVHHRPGVQLNDYVLNWLPPVDWSIEIFVLIFGAPALFFLFNFKNPVAVLMSLQCYVIVNFMRLITIYLFTLEAPEGLIPLIDPFLAKVAYGGNAVFVKDLFFSGHTSTLFIIFLIEQNKSRKHILLISTVLVGLLLIWQHVHYSIDIVGAIFISWLVFLVFKFLNERSGLKLG